MTGNRWLKAFGPPLAVVFVLLIVWQMAVALFHIELWILPDPLYILQEGSRNFPRLLMHFMATLRLTLIGFVIGVIIGVGTSWLLHLVPWVKRGFYPILILSQNIPMIALAPLLMLWFGFGLFPKVVVITIVCFFPIAVAMMDGYLQTDPVMLNYMKMIGASKLQIFRKLELPHALPSFFSGLKISATYAVSGAIVSEWLGADKGIGYYMKLEKAGFKTVLVFDSIFIIVLLSVLLFQSIVLIERLVIRWKTRSHKWN
ncbi:MAG: transporter permease [Bacilli bacterium]|jgi:ABC-type nitrate/sulfonate/bicarbonate transport system permease component|nr:transporter permease [Bacilli bacterium]